MGVSRTGNENVTVRGWVADESGAVVHADDWTLVVNPVVSVEVGFVMRAKRAHS